MTTELTGLEEYVEAVRTANELLAQQEETAVNIDIVLEETLESGPGVFTGLDESVQHAADALSEASDACDTELDNATAQAKTVAEERLPHAEDELEKLSDELDALLDPLRTQVVHAFETLASEGFTPAQHALEANATTLEQADDEGSSLQPFLQLHTHVEELTTTHETEQSETAGELDTETHDLDGAAQALTERAQAGATRWGQESAEIISRASKQEAEAAGDIYEAWDAVANDQASALETLLTTSHTRLTGLLETDQPTLDTSSHDAQEALDVLKREIEQASEAMDDSDGIIDTLVDTFAPELSIAKTIAGKLKDIADAVGGS